MEIYSPLCEEKVGVINPVDYCLLQQKRGFRVRRDLALALERGACRLALLLKCRASQACVLKLKRDIN